MTTDMQKTADVAERIKQTLEYVRTELDPKYLDEEISSSAGGVRPNDLIHLLDVIQAMGNALAFYVEGDNPAREAFARAVPLMNLKGEG